MTWPRQTGANEPDKTGAGLWRRIAPATAGSVWMAVLLGALVWLDLRRGGIFLVPPFAATMTILVYLPDVAVAQPFAIVFGSTLGAATGTVL